MKRISILGSTGSIGTQTLDIVKQHPEQFKVEALAAGNNIALLLSQIKEFQPSIVSVQNKAAADCLYKDLPRGIELYYGEEGLIEVAASSETDIVVIAVVGSIGLKPTLAAIDKGKTIAFANKETLVAAGQLVTDRARSKGVRLIPIDSEHSAIFQCLNGESPHRIRAVTLTASGGSFRDHTRDELVHVTVKQALQHPNWFMGSKLTIDSATMANKGLEIIEAHWLFGVPYGQIQVLIHPESIIHALVEFVDGSIIAQLNVPDMRVPIQYALTYPEKMSNSSAPLNLAEVGKLNFREMDKDRFPMIRYAYECGKIGGTATTVFNAANEAAVARFIRGEISFLDIERIVCSLISKHDAIIQPSLEAILETDACVRAEALSMS